MHNLNSGIALNHLPLWSAGNMGRWLGLFRRGPIIQINHVPIFFGQER